MTQQYYKNKIKIRQIFNYVHEAHSGHQTTCKQNHGTEYGNLEHVLEINNFQMRRSSPHLRMAKSYGQIH